MLNEQQLRSIFESRYSPESWTSILRENFNASKLHKKPVDITARIKENSYKAKAFELGSMETIEGYLIGLYQVDVPSKAQLHRNRKGLRNLLGNVYSNDVDAALVVFVQEEKWRFTYVSEITTKEDGKRKKKATDPKRYTYLFGKGEKAKTAAQQFVKIRVEENLLEKGIKLQALNDFFNVDKMSKAFFDEYRQHYGKFTAYITGEDENQKKIGKASPLFKSTFDGQPKEARDFVKKMLGRIVFLYFLEKKGWLGVPLDEKWGDGDVNFLSNLFKNSKDQDAFYSNVLAPLFFTALNTKRTDDVYKLPNGEKVKIPFLNGGLFEEEDNEKTPYLQFPMKLFADLFDFFDRYNFTVYEDSPDEHTVAVDPEMLGHIFENLLEDNKDKGAYYTPKEIVHYMCQESLIQYLYTKINPGVKAELDNTVKDKAKVLSREALERFIKNHEALGINDYEERILEALRDVKVCDPAIGSGAFPMGVLMEIYYAVETLFYLAPDTVNTIWKLGNNNQVFNAAKVKESIIQNSIYGVDIEQGAVDIARLRFWLSLVVDEDIPKPLPNLDYKIVVGNSLLSKFEDEVIDIEWNYTLSHGTADTKSLIATQVLKLQTLQVWQEAYFNKNGDKQKQQLDIRNIKIDILINQLTLSKLSFKHSNPKLGGFAPTAKEIQKNLENELIQANYDKTIKKLEAIKKDKKTLFKFFDWKLDFPEIMNDRIAKNVGFDLVIGNPPYIQLQNNGGALAKELQSKRYETFERTGDIYTLFYEKGYHLLKDNAHLIYITSNKWMRAGYGESTRSFFVKKTTPILLVDFAGQKIFEATVDTNILMFQKHVDKINTIACIVRDGGLANLSDYINKNKVQLAFSTSSSWVILTNIEQRIKEKIDSIGIPLKNWDIQINYGVKTGCNEAFLIDGNKRKELIKQDPKSAEIIRPVLRGRDIKRYCYEFADLYLITTFPSLKIDIENYPAIKHHLSSFGYHRLKQTGDIGARKKTNNKWFETQDSISYWEDFSRPKITWGNLNLSASYTLAESNLFVNAPSPIIVPAHNFLLGILNSKLADYYIRKLGVTRNGGYFEYKPMFIEKLPVPRLNPKQEQQFDKIIKTLLEKKSQNLPTRQLEQEIDNLVFELYQLTEEEKKFILNQD